MSASSAKSLIQSSDMLHDARTRQQDFRWYFNRLMPHSAVGYRSSAALRLPLDATSHLKYPFGNRFKLQ